jgi:hypothetical protein
MLLQDPALRLSIARLLTLLCFCGYAGFDRCPQTASLPIHCNNRSAIQIAHNDFFHERTKHIKIDCHFMHHLQQHTLRL